MGLWYYDYKITSSQWSLSSPFQPLFAADHSEMLRPITKVMRGQLEETSPMLIGVSQT